MENEKQRRRLSDILIKCKQCDEVLFLWMREYGPNPRLPPKLECMKCKETYKMDWRFPFLNMYTDDV